GRRLAAMSAPAAEDVRRRLESAGHGDLLLGEWAEICAHTGDPQSAFERYRRTVLAGLPAFDRSYSHRVAEILLDRLPDGRRPALALDWLRSGEVDRFPPELAVECVRLANRAVSLASGDREEDPNAEAVAAAATRMRITLRPDRP